MLKKLTLFLIVFALFSAGAFAYECTDKCKIQGNSCLCPSAPMWVSQDSPLTVISGNGTHVIKIIDVTINGDSCGISVDDVIKWIPLDKTIEVNGITVVLFDAKTVHSQLEDIDTCRLFISGTVVLPVQKILVENNTNTTNAAFMEPANITESNVTANETKENVTEQPLVQEQPKTVWQLIFDFFVNLFKG